MADYRMPAGTYRPPLIRTGPGGQEEITEYLVACGFCGGHHIGHNSTSMGSAYFCPKHLAAMFAGFAPQVSDVVSYIDGPQRAYVVLGREGDMLTLRHLGDPDAPLQIASVHSLWPGDGRCIETIYRGLGE